MRLGDLDALADKVRESMYDNPHTDSMVRRTHIHEHDCFLRTISLAPTIDAVPVVRCKDCKHYQTDDWDGNILCGCTLHSAMLDITPDSFCSYGERKDGEG